MRQPGRTYARTDGQAENIMPTGRAEAQNVKNVKNC